jgi:aarF domain-containing kinase
MIRATTAVSSQSTLYTRRLYRVLNLQSSLQSSSCLVPVQVLLVPSFLIRVPTQRLLSSASTSPSSGNASAPPTTLPQNSSSQGRNWKVWGAAGTLLFGAVAAKYYHDHFGGFDGVTRSLSFYSLAIPKYIQYRYHQWKDSPDPVWDDLHRTTSQQGLDKILDLQGFYVKCGQLCAANIGNAFPPIWQDTMSILQDQVPAQPFSVIRSIVDAELGMDRVFATFESTPIGSASIGQVHRATLKDGTRVVVKVCYPHVERLLRGDVRTIKLFAQVAQPVHVPALEEIEQQFQTEFDYVQEALQLNTVRLNLTQAGLAGPDKLCQVPRPYLEFCTKRVLVMEELRGDKLAVELKRDVQRTAERVGQSTEDFMAVQKAKEQELKAVGKEMVGPSTQEYNMYISMFDMQRKWHNTKSRLYNWTIGLLPQASRKEVWDRAVLPLNHAQLVDDLIYIHGHEVLVDGCFNGDPHPGNILLIRKPDGSPQIGLIDYGQVKRLDKQTRHLFARIILALCDDDRPRIIELMKEAGFRSKTMNPDVIFLYAKVSYDMDNQELTGGKHIQMFMEDIEKMDPIVQLPQDLIMIGRTSLLLRGLCHALHQPRSIAHAWKPIAERVLREDL